MSGANQHANILRIKVAHLNAKGVDLIVIPVASAFGQLKRLEQEKAVQSLQYYAAAAGLRGSVVPIWDKGAGKAEFLAEKQLHPLLQSLSLPVVHQHINREFKLSALQLGNLAALLSGTPAATPAKQDQPGTLVVSCDLQDAQVYVDGSFVGNIGGRIRVGAGERTVEVKCSGYRDWRQQVQIPSGSEIHLRADLEPDTAVLDDLGNHVELDRAMEHRGKVAAFQRKHRIGLVTLMFTDMVGSTKMKQQLGDREAVKLIQSHHSEVRQLLRKFPGGEEISTAGDSFFIVFAKPSEAVKFGLQLQARLRRWCQETGWALKDRIGVHVGEVFIEEVEGSRQMNDLYGIQVDTCARVMSLAEGDQILMTRFAFDNARQVLRGQMIDGVRDLAWKNHGLYSLKGVDDPLEICEVGETGLAVLKAPANSEKAHRFGAGDNDAGLQPPRPERPAPAQHVVVSTKSSFPLKPLRLPSFPPAGDGQ